MPNICSSLNNNSLFNKRSLSKTPKISYKVSIFLLDWTCLKMFPLPWKVSAMIKILITVYPKSSVASKDVHQKRLPVKAQDILSWNPQEEVTMTFSKLSIKSNAIVHKIHWMLLNLFSKSTKRTWTKSYKSKKSTHFINFRR